ncbi:adrenodoxin reductase [Tieghemostelium lacteum]|uniref:NADPH:adrenodoxin oxidoreductase, mitochondrial n=1 Tax=Tieghemostelium lacteum TaxID=361077 RepID=A0A151ZBR3_TIELA|nr:adrenodoxin reductase [Tieghemostelium lacteum]|eukprot:KYQ91379.1 adrenodoxin reductase [Tieghemostelium lacteum]
MLKSKHILVLKSYCRYYSTSNNIAGPLKLCIIGSGPAGLYTANKIIKKLPDTDITIIDKLPSPFGLIRYGIAPDHQEQKRVKNLLEKTLIEHPQTIRFLGNVDMNTDLNLKDILASFNATVLACGIEGEKKLGIPGETLDCIYSAREFTSWLNGHPHFQQKIFNLSPEKKDVVIVGQGNVALDVARLLIKKDNKELAQTDITSKAMDIISKSAVKNIHIVGRRGPVESSFSTKELREICKLPNVQTWVNDRSIIDSIDTQSEPLLKDRIRQRVFQIFNDYLKPIPSEGLPQNDDKVNLIFHFLRSPNEFIESEKIGNSVSKVKLEVNQLIRDNETSDTKAKGTGQFESINCDIVFRSIGYTGVPIEGVPFDYKNVKVPNFQGKVLQKVNSDNQYIDGLFVSGWIKTGPTGTIAAIDKNVEETTEMIYLDYQNNRLDLQKEKQGYKHIIEHLINTHKQTTNFDDWKKIEQEELKRGKQLGKLSEKIIIFDDLKNIININNNNNNNNS